MIDHSKAIMKKLEEVRKRIYESDLKSEGYNIKKTMKNLGEFYDPSETLYELSKLSNEDIKKVFQDFSSSEMGMFRKALDSSNAHNDSFFDKMNSQLDNYSVICSRFESRLKKIYDNNEIDSKDTPLEFKNKIIENKEGVQGVRRNRQNR